MDKSAYEIAEAGRVLTPALLVYPEVVAGNIRTTLGLLGGDPGRFRPHIKTIKLSSIVRELVSQGVGALKCATTLELTMAAAAGAKDVLVAFPMFGPGARRVREIARSFPSLVVSVLVETPAMAAEWKGSRVGVFVDINPGMDRTGIGQERVAEILDLIKGIRRDRIAFRGLHYYDGHLAGFGLEERTKVAQRGYDRLLSLIDAIEREGIDVECVITAGTPTFPCSLSYPGFQNGKFRHQVSPGTILFNDVRSLQQLPGEWGYRCAALVLSRVVSRPKANMVTCDAGHKAVPVDAGVPNCQVLGREDLLPRKPSEEHLPIEVLPGGSAPEIGDALYLLPKHICPTVNLFDHALMVEKGRIARLETVAARGHENPLILSGGQPPSA